MSCLRWLALGSYWKSTIVNVFKSYLNIYPRYYWVYEEYKRRKKDGNKSVSGQYNVNKLGGIGIRFDHKNNTFEFYLFACNFYTYRISKITKMISYAQ